MEPQLVGPLSPLEVEVLLLLQLEKLPVVTLGEIKPAVEPALEAIDLTLLLLMAAVWALVCVMAVKQ